MLRGRRAGRPYDRTVASTEPEAQRKERGAWYTPPALVDLLLEAALDPSWVSERGGAWRVIDPACGDGRFLARADELLRELGVTHIELVGIDIDAGAADAARRRCPSATIVHGDALVGTTLDIAPFTPERGPFDLVVGNPPFLSQLAASTARGGASRHGGGPYADAAVEFLALGSRLVDQSGGRLGFVLPQSLLAARDAADVRRSIDERATLSWSSWTGARDFDAQVVTCALLFEFGGEAPRRRSSGSWAVVVTERLGVPPVPDAMSTNGSGVVLSDLGWINANFRDEYYGMIPAVDDHDRGPPLVTSGLIDPGRCRWGERRVRFAKRNFEAPRIDIDALDDRMRAWAERRLRPKVLIANQTRILEAVADPAGEWLPGVPVVSVYPGDPQTVWEIAAVLTSASASAWAWHERGGTGLSANAIRVGPVMLGELPWPSGPLDAAVACLRAGDLAGCGRAVDRAYGVDADEAAALAAWWLPLVGS